MRTYCSGLGHLSQCLPEWQKTWLRESSWGCVTLEKWKFCASEWSKQQRQQQNKNWIFVRTVNPTWVYLHLKIHFLLFVLTMILSQPSSFIVLITQSSRYVRMITAVSQSSPWSFYRMKHLRVGKVEYDNVTVFKVEDVVSLVWMLWQRTTMKKTWIAVIALLESQVSIHIWIRVQGTLPLISSVTVARKMDTRNAN